MPLTAQLQTGVFDATSCDDFAWTSIHRARPRPSLLCRSCDATMHAKVSKLGMRFFAHDRAQPTCPSAGETLEHLLLKWQLAEHIRESGWIANIEAEPDIGDAGGWRADVLAIGDGRRVAFEVQLATMTVDVGADRTARHARDAIETVWVTSRNAPWLYALPGIKVVEDPERLGARIVQRGCAQLEAGSDRDWRSRTDLPLRQLVGSVLIGKAMATTIGYLSEDRALVGLRQTASHHPATVLAPVSHWQRHQTALEQDAARQRRAERDAADHERRIRLLYERQERTLPIAVAEARAALPSGERIWLGVPPTTINADGTFELREASGNDATARGAAIWTGFDRGSLRLFAVVCPVASRITTGLAESWRSRGVRIFVAEHQERRRVAQALGWPIGLLELH